jgi:integrase
MRVDELFENHFRPLRLRGRSAATTRLYRCTLRSYERWLGRPAVTETDFEDLTLCRFLEDRTKTRSPYTAERERNQLCSLWRFARDRGIMPTAPCVPAAGRLPERVPSAWSVEQLKHLVSIAGATPGFVGDVPAGIFWRALVCTLYETAERCGAVFAARVCDWSRPRLIVLAEHRKGGKRDRLYTLTDETADLVDFLCRNHPPTDLIWRWDRCHTHIWSRFGDIVSAAGLGEGRRAKFHQLRRCAASHYAARGGNSTALLDHSSPRVTRAYIDPRYADLGVPPSHVLPSIHGGGPAGGGHAG